MKRGLLTLIAAAAVGCGAGARAVDRPPATPSDVAASRVARATDRALATSDRVDPIRALVRSNPASCDCPAWEVMLRGRWERVELRPARDASDDDLALLGGSLAEGRHLEATLSATGDIVVAGDGWRYAVFEIAAIGVEDPSMQPPP